MAEQLAEVGFRLPEAAAIAFARWLLKMLPRHEEETERGAAAKNNRQQRAAAGSTRGRQQ
jgi:hypothetical protein